MSGNESLGDYLKYAAECGVLEMVEGSMALSQELRGWTGIEAGKEMQELGGQKEEAKERNLPGAFAIGEK